MATTNIATYISQIESDRNTIRTKLTDLGLATATSKLTDCATAINGIVNRGSVSATVTEGATYSIPAGYHDGSGTVSGVAGGGNYSLQSKSVTPTKAQQAITPDSGYYGLSDVTVKAIPDNYQDVSSVDATAADVLANKKYVTADGTLTAGTMTNNGTVTKTLDTTTTSYTIPKGYHSGSGKVSITTETKTATPTEETQNITPTSGKVLSKVIVDPIPTNYKDISGVTATADTVLEGSSFVSSDGTTVEGTIPVKEEENVYLTTLNPTLTIPKGYYDGESQKVYVSSKTQTVTPTKSSQKLKGNHFFSEVTVEAIPEAYQDVTEVTATAVDVLIGKSFVASDGTTAEGEMSNNGAVDVTLTPANPYYVVPTGYHNGSGKVSITTETKSATPTKSSQTITPTSGKVLSSVTVAPIPDEYQDVSGVTATADTVLAGSKFVDASGALTEGTISTLSESIYIDGMTQTSITLGNAYYQGSKVSLTTSIEEALAAI